MAALPVVDWFHIGIVPVNVPAVVANVADEALPVNSPTSLGAIKDEFSPINFTPPADICKFPATLLNTAAGISLSKVSLAMDNEPEEINNPLKGLLIVPKVDVVPNASILPATVTFLEALISPSIFKLKGDVAFNKSLFTKLSWRVESIKISLVPSK